MTTVMPWPRHEKRHGGGARERRQHEELPRLQRLIDWFAGGRIRFYPDVGC
jgi:hypothetical protein